MYLTYHSRPAGRRAGLLLTVCVHAALLVGWQMARRLPPLPSATDRPGIQWIWLPAPRERAPAPTHEPAPAPTHAPARAPERDGRTRPRGLAPAALPSPSPSSAPPLALPVPAPSPAGAATQAAIPAPAQDRSAGQILDQARRDIGKIDKALRKENRPYLAAPLDSPQIRLRKGIELANEMAPNRLWEAPKTEDLVNDTGDGARRTRVITGNGTYCITERATNTSIDMIEKHGKLRITSCPQHEQPATRQDWRTARD